MPSMSKVSAMPHHSSMELDPMNYASSSFVERGELLEDWWQEGLQANRSQGEQPVRRSSFRLMVVHILHATLLLIGILTLLTSFPHWEHGVEIDINCVAQTTSTITILVQIFFTASISLLYLLSSAVAIDAAIRHPRSIIDLDYRLQAWYGGVGSSVMNGLFQMHRFRQISRSVLVGIPLYFIAGEILKLTSSSVLGVSIYNRAMISNRSVHNHLIPFDYYSLVHLDHEGYYCSSMTNISSDWYKMQDLWVVSTRTIRPDIFDNETSHSGLIGNVLYDIPDSSHPFDEVNVNGTKMNVRCSHIKPEDSVFRPPFESDMTISGPSDNHYVLWPSNNQNASSAFARLINRPPYGTRNSSFFNTSTPLHLDLENDIYITNHILLQPWGFDDWNDEDGYKGASNQVLMVVVAPKSDLLLHDATGSVASVNITSLLASDDCLSACSSNGLDEASAECVDYFRDHSECVAEDTTWYFQALGCTLRTTQVELSFNFAGLLVNGSAHLKPSAAHVWDNFSAVNPRDGNDFLATEFLEMFVPANCTMDDGRFQQDQDYMSGVLLHILEKNRDLAFFENMLANMTASYLWNIWQLCDQPFDNGWRYQQCWESENDTSVLTSGKAQYISHQTRARLHIVKWKAAVTVLCAIALCALAFYLLGTTTDSRAGTPLRDATFMEAARLLKDSAIPDIVMSSAPGFDQTSLRYIRRGSKEFTAHLDIRK